jgi:hypothetical protein
VEDACEMDHWAFYGQFFPRGLFSCHMSNRTGGELEGRSSSANQLPSRLGWNGPRMLPRIRFTNPMLRFYPSSSHLPTCYLCWQDVQCNALFQLGKRPLIDNLCQTCHLGIELVLSGTPSKLLLVTLFQLSLFLHHPGGGSH